MPSNLSAKQRAAQTEELIQAKVTQHRSRFASTTEVQWRAWCKNLRHSLRLYPTFETVKWQIEEIFEYLTEEHLAQGCVALHGEKNYVYSLLRQQLREKQPPLHRLHALLQEPAVTFGVSLDAMTCPRCGNKNVTSMAIQKRSSDEPTNYFFECPARDCNWRGKDV